MPITHKTKSGKIGAVQWNQAHDVSIELTDLAAEVISAMSGTPGPQGDPGPKGDTGDTGPKGDTGAPGSDASVTKANVEAVLTGEISTHTHPGGGASAYRISVEMFRDGVAIADTNQPAALRFFKNLPYQAAQLIDLSVYSQVRFNVMKDAVAGAAASKMILRYISNFTTTAANWSDIGTSEVSIATNVQNQALTTGWIDLVAGAKGDVYIGILTSGGDGALDPKFGNIGAEFKS
jgi:hypothetical protein